MKRIVLLLLVSSLAFATEDFQASCLSAGGYYGNVSAKSTTDGKMKVIAAQGFGYELTQQLGLPSSYAIHLSFEESDCKIVTSSSASKLIRCQATGLEASLKNKNPSGPIQVNEAVFEIKEALLETVDGKKESTLVSLFMNVPNDKGGPVRGRVTYHFTKPLGECLFN